MGLKSIKIFCLVALHFSISIGGDVPKAFHGSFDKRQVAVYCGFNPVDCGNGYCCMYGYSCQPAANGYDCLDMLLTDATGGPATTIPAYNPSSDDAVLSSLSITLSTENNFATTGTTATATGVAAATAPPAPTSTSGVGANDIGSLGGNFMSWVAVSLAYMLL